MPGKLVEDVLAGLLVGHPDIPDVTRKALEALLKDEYERGWDEGYEKARDAWRD